MLDNLAPGRLTLIARLGYCESEYCMLGGDWERRGQALEDNIDIMQLAWQGQPFEYRGAQVQVQVQVQVLPRPVRPHPLPP